jgi:tRNA G18 (ribose-2'-O)-methylase SpoU
MSIPKMKIIDLGREPRSPEEVMRNPPSFEHWSADERNVRDEFKNIPTEEIKHILEERSFPYAVCFEQWQGDFNMSSGVRNANAFAAREVFYIGKKRWDRRGAVGTQNYTSVKHLDSLESLAKLKEKYVLIGLDNVEGSGEMESFVWPDNSLMIFGEESIGITKEVIAICDKLISIKQYGSVRSLNASVASGIAMFDYVNKKSK